jgi:hypothetical protein
VLLVVEYATGMYVNLYVTVPGADHGGSLGSAISNGPASLSVHAVIGLLLELGALCVAAQSILVRHWELIAASVIGLLAMVFASVAGTGFTSTRRRLRLDGHVRAERIAMLCYAANLYLLRPGIRRG